MVTHSIRYSLSRSVAGKLDLYSWLPVVLIGLFGCTGTADQSTGAMRLAHQRVASVQAGSTIPIDLSFAPDSEIKEVRVYFKLMGEKRYLFRKLEPTRKTKGVRFYTELPAPRNGSRGMDYRILIASNNTEHPPLLTRNYRLLVMDTRGVFTTADSPMQVFTETAELAGTSEAYLTPLKISVTTTPLLAQATPYQHDPIEIPGPARRTPSSVFSGPGGFSFSIELGGAALRYGSAGF